MFRGVTDRRKGGAVYNFEYTLASACEARLESDKNRGKNRGNCIPGVSANLLTALKALRTLAAFLFQTLFVFNGLSFYLSRGVNSTTRDQGSS